MSAKRQIKLVELQRQIRVAVDALRVVERSLARELGEGTLSAPVDLAGRIRDATKAVVSGAKDY